MKVLIADEANVRAASKLLNERIKAYSDQFGLHDQQDLLAMVAFDCLIDTLKAKEGKPLEEQALAEQVNSLIELVNQAFPNPIHQSYATS